MKLGVAGFDIGLTPVGIEVPIRMETTCGSKHGRAGMISFRFAIAVGMLFMSTTFADARSCTEQGRECAGWAVGQYASYKGACSKEVGACKARCKQGQKYFLGVLVGNQYPIDTCN